MNAKGWNAHYWKGLMTGLLVAVAVHLAAVTSTEPTGDAWPVLLATEPVTVDPDFAALQQRASGSLERLVQAARETEQPL